MVRTKKSPKKTGKSRKKQAVYTYRPPKPEPTWTDAYGECRRADQMTTDHLFNVLGWIRDRHSSWQESPGHRRQGLTPFYWSAVKELRKRGYL